LRSSALYKKILQDAYEGKDVSKVVDENGAPLVVYHGTKAEFDTFDRNKGNLNDAGWSGEGHYFYGDFNEATQYAWGNSGNIMAEFLNIRTPYYLSDTERNGLVDRNDRDYSIEFSEQLKDDGYDGVYYNGDLRQEWTAFAPEQIKSATGNAGTFSEETGNINFQEEAENQSKPEKLADVVTIDSSVMKDVDGKAIDFDTTKVKPIREWLIKNFVGKIVEIQGNKNIQRYTPDGLKASLKLKRDKNHNKMYGQLSRLIENAVYDKTIDVDARHQGRVAGQQEYHVPARLGNGLYNVTIKLDLPLEGTELSYKDHKIKKIEIDPLLRKRADNQPDFAELGAISKVNVEVLQGIVNPTRLEPDGKGGQILFQDAWHGTPHYIVDGFSTQKIGTGEGAQAYGWGLYAAEDRKVSAGYAERLGEPLVYFLDDKQLDSTDERIDLIYRLFDDGTNITARKDIEEAVTTLKNNRKYSRPPTFPLKDLMKNLPPMKKRRLCLNINLGS
jgi:hypothetical protein